MFRERYRAIKNGWEKDKMHLAEFREFAKIFDPLMALDGILTLQDTPELDPLGRGLLVAKHSSKIIDKLRKDKILSENDKREVREAAWLTSIGGLYNYGVDLESESTSISVCVDNSDLMDYWVDEAKNITGYLQYFDSKRLRRIKNIDINTTDGNLPLTFCFPNGIDLSSFPNLFVAVSDQIKYSHKRLLLLDIVSYA